jgi:2-(1,2-epoxy-1,2-dihydrophenyl)acetyl-CoA isomerase
MQFETIEFTVENGVGQLFLNRPDRLNSFTDQMHAEMRSCLKTVARDDDIRCLLLSGRGRGFCAGQDLSDRDVAADETMPDLGQTVERNWNPLVRTLRKLEKPVVCAVNGVAAGAGSSVAIACDIVYAARSAKFIQSFSNVGLVPDTGGSWTLPRLVGHARAMGLAILGEKISAEQAADWGMIWKCVDDDDLLPQTIALAEYLATRPTRGLAYTKRALTASLSNSLDEQLDLERDLMRMAGRTEDYREGVNAFMNKRDPEFKGR